ncbi:hypothetical protein DPX16_8309 [Anabarilius grahami]|uniref:Uncharacterized protein n=1 Tax=Anabarilius grahami TaxID=495550 RepID=A0A3N0YH43_ANAGA|nr:hypothetical protein DPX16_8309 [Anabarilius grahami]
MLRTHHLTQYAYEELLEVVTHAVARLNIDWPAEKQEVLQQSLLDECFLTSRSQPPHQGLPFFPDLHTEVSRLWKKPVSYHVFSPQTSNYSIIAGLKLYGYEATLRVASYLSHKSASSLKALKLPTKPIRTTSALVGKAYSAAGRDKRYLLDTQLAPPGLFGDAVTSVIERFQEAKKLAVAFQKLLPHRSQVPGTAGQEQSLPSTSSSYRAQQKVSVATRAPPQKVWGSGWLSQPKPSKDKTDLRTIIISKKASAKKS